MDGHRTHHSPKMMRYAVEDNVITTSYPGRSTRLRPLAVCLIELLQRAYSKTVAEHLKTRTGVTRVLFWFFFCSSTTRSIYCTKYQSIMAKGGKCAIQSCQRSQSVTSHHSRCRRHAKPIHQSESTYCTKNTSKPARTAAAYFGCNNTHITKRGFHHHSKRG